MSKIIKKIKSKNILNILDNKEYRAALDAAATLTCQRRVSINFIGEDSYTDGNSITIGIFDFLKNHTNYVIKTCLVACALHEAEHIVSTDFNYLSSIRKEYEEKDELHLYIFFFNIFNCIEDGRIENIHQNRYRNNIKYIKTLRKLWYENQKVLLKEEVKKIYEEDMTVFLKNNPEKFTQEEIEKMINDNFEKELRSKKICDFVFWVCSIATTKKSPINFDREYSNDKVAFNFTNKFKNRILDAVNINKTTKEVWSLAKDIGNFLLVNMENIEEYILSIKICSSFGVAGVGVGCDHSNIINSDPITENLDSVEIDKKLKESLDSIDKCKNEPVVNQQYNEPIWRNIDIRPLNSPYTAIIEELKYQLKKILDLDFLKEQRGLKRGRINSKDLWKTSLGRKDIFYKRKEEFKKNIALHLLIDCSGSMDMCNYVNSEGKSISNMQIANRTAAILEESFSAYINMAITYFNTSLFTLRKFDDFSTDSYVWAIQKKASGGTNDYSAVKYAISTLKCRKERKKIVVVISDGWGYVDFVREEVNIGKTYGINCIGLALDIRDENFEKMYDYFINCESSSLESQLINTIKRCL